MRIGYHCYEPELLDNGESTSMGGGSWTRFLFDQLTRAGHRIVWLADGERPPLTEPFAGFEHTKMDVIVCCWRWAMPDYPDRQRAYEHQMVLIRKAYDYHVPVIVHDQDHKISPIDMEFIKKAGAILTAPEFFPREGFRTLMFPDPYKETRLPLRPSFSEPARLVYVGNNYERFSQAKEFLGKASVEYETTVYGNWLEPSAHRQSPEEVFVNMPQVHFKDRLPQKMVVRTLSKSDFTIHLFKESYGPPGFVTMRWAEAAAAGIPAFIPEDFRIPPTWWIRLSLMIVKDGDKLVEAIKDTDTFDWLDAIKWQRKLVDEYMTVDGWLEILKSVV